MLRFVRNSVICLLAVLAPAASVLGQLHPMPGSQSEPEVLCTGCLEHNSFGQPNDGLPTWPYDDPIKDHTGRYVDSTSTASFQHLGFRTARAGMIRVADSRRGSAPPRIYIQIGNAVGAYTLDKFFSQMLPAGMTSIRGVKTGESVTGFNRAPYEKVVMFEGFVYPEAKDSLWHCPFQDGQDRLGAGAPFDVDDRGYLYVAYSVFGWGIVEDDGRTDQTHFQTIMQMIPGGPDVASQHPKTIDDPTCRPERCDAVMPESIVAMKVGSKYYAVVGDETGKQAVWDVTTPSAPKHVVTRTGTKWGIRKWDRDDAAQRVAVIGSDRKLYVYDYASFIAGASPSTALEQGGGFADVSFDESGNLWAAEVATNIWKFTPSGNGYTQAVYNPYPAKFEHATMHVAAGHIFTSGKNFAGGLAYDAALLKIEAAGPRYLDLNSFFTKYYHKSPVNYAQPANNTGIQMDTQVVKAGGKTYIMYSVFGLGDVFEIAGEDSISIKVKNNSYGTQNPNSKGTAGPYVGDIVTFTAPSSNPQVLYDVTWDFGNPESSDNTGLKKSNVEITHQYTGLTTSAKITQPKLVKAITVQSSGIASQFSLALKVPTPRVGISGLSEPITSDTTGLKLVAGQTFNDASDGSVEGHYGKWTIGTTLTKLAPNATIPVGDVGPQTLEFEAAYGKHDASFNGTSPYLTAPINIDYTVLPFKATINAPTAAGSNVTFTGQPLVATAPTVTAGVWNVTWTFNPGGTSAAAVTTQTTSATINTIPSFSVPKTDVINGSTVTLKVEVDPLGLATPAQNYTTFTDTMTLAAPDPKITRTGCGNVGAACEFAASSVSDPAMTGWTYAWTLSGPGANLTGTTNPWKPTIAVQGSYTISLKVTKSIFETTLGPTSIPTVGPSLCDALPSSQNLTVGMTPNCKQGCAQGTKITFWPTFFGYSLQSCDTVTWNFGSGQGTGTGTEVEHTYSSAGTYTVTVKVTNSNGSVSKTATVVINGSGGGDPGGGTTCTAPTSATISYSGCQTGGCRTTDTISFSAKRGSATLQTCDNVRWSFSDGTTSSSRTPSKKFSTPGTYTVQMHIENTKGTSPTDTKTITVTQGSAGGSCAAAPGPGNFAITFAGPASGCTNINGQECQAAENISFDADDYYYAPGTCDHYEWDFGDSSAKTATRATTHTYASAGTYPVKLRVYNNQGEWTYSKSLRVGGTTSNEPIPQITATSFPSTGIKGRSVTFTATSSIANTTGWTWSFGDNTGNDTSQAGQTKASSTITHTFTKTGTFTVRVTGRNAADAPTAPVGLAQATIAIADAPAIPEYRFLLPVTAHAGGLGGSKWRTDVQIYVGDPAVGTEANPLQMEAEFKGRAYQLPLIKKTHIYEDFLGILLQGQKDDQGPVIITTKNATVAPMIWTRTYNQSENGTFGQFIPAIRIDSNAGGAGAIAEGKYYLAGLRHDDRYRTNIGFLNPNAAALTATVTVYDDRHFGIKQFSRTLQPFQLDQITLKNVVENLPTDRPFSVEIEVPSGNWLVAYASFIDGLSQDPVYLQAIRDSEVASADFSTTIIPGVGHTGAWRSDVTIFNPDGDGLRFDLQYFDGAGNKLAEAPGIMLEPRQFIQYGDLLKQGVLGDVPDGLGTLKIVNTSAVPNEMQPMSFARTYNDDGANGTFGQGIPAFAAARANVKPNKPALLAGVRNSVGQYYTNIGLVNVSNAQVTATVTLLDPVSGGAVASIPYTLNPNQTIVGRYNGWGAITTGTFKIEATGDVWAFASVVDERTKDPEYVAATPMQLP